MESMQYDKNVALDILNRVHISIEHIEERSQPYHCGDDFLMSSTGVAILDSKIFSNLGTILPYYCYIILNCSHNTYL